MNVAKFRAMIEGGAPDWDVADITIDFLYAGIKDKLFEKIDKSIVDTSRLDPRFVNDYGIGCIVWSYNLGYSTKAYPGEDAPQDLGRPVRPQEIPRQAHLRRQSRGRRSKSRCWPTAWRPTSSIRWMSSGR